MYMHYQCLRRTSHCDMMKTPEKNRLSGNQKLTIITRRRKLISREEEVGEKLNNTLGSYD